ncbi:carboxypeptidase regulatory-like domain-containing protein [Aulosira sp. FACHB-615]|uniref:carboxypeptidase regulatory-like domain-containing protein n=1 Tax=Aulosira sp. FACHB-615 TaxID=2692777 RepID=UPI00168572AE|nr:carboxypeptidase regulatory-like domain-containing protein [Aulosira sp. FACHB-615]MBD2488866.1 carboxypeptidase regulatory-like domain-containing protein [Aulosira sp. FACHB-615]
MIYQASPPLPPAEVTTLPAQDAPITAPDKNSANPAYKTARHTVATPLPPETTPEAEFSTNGVEEQESSAESNSGEVPVQRSTKGTILSDISFTSGIPEVSNTSTQELDKCTTATNSAPTVSISASSAISEESPDLLTKQLVKCKPVKAPSKVTTTSETPKKPSNLVALSTEQPAQPSPQQQVKAPTQFATTTPENSAATTEQPVQASVQQKVKAPTQFATTTPENSAATTEKPAQASVQRKVKAPTQVATTTSDNSAATTKKPAQASVQQKVKAPTQVATTTSDNSAATTKKPAQASVQQKVKAPTQVATTTSDNSAATTKKPAQASVQQKVKAPTQVATTTSDNSASTTKKPAQTSVQRKVKTPTQVATTTFDNKTKPKTSVQRRRTTAPVKVANSENDSTKLKQPPQPQNTKVEVASNADAAKTPEELTGFLTKQPQQRQNTTASASATIAAKAPEDLATFVNKQRSQTITALSEVATNETDTNVDNFGTFLAKQTPQSQFPDVTTTESTAATSETSINSHDLAAFLTKQPSNSSLQYKVANVPSEVPTNSQTSKKSEDLSAFLTKQPAHPQVPQKTATNTTPAPSSATESTPQPNTKPAEVQPPKQGVDVSKNILNIDDNSRITFTQTASSNLENLLLGVIINRKEVGSLDVIRQGNTLLLPLDDFAKLAGFTVETKDNNTYLNTPLGTINLAESDIQNFKGINYISDAFVREKLSTNIEFNSLDLALIIDLPWRGDGTAYTNQAVNLQPDVFAPLNGFSNLRQELNIVNNAGDVNLRSSTLLGGRLAGGLWRVRVNNNFENSPDVSEYFYYKRNGRFLYQVGRQQIGINPLVNSLNLTGAQFGYTNIPTNRFNQTNNANELLPRRSRPLQTFQGVVPAASFVQLRVSGVVVAQQQVGFDGRYEFVDVNLPVGQNNQIEILVFDRNNLNVPSEIRSVRINASDLLLPAGGNVQLAGVGLTGNLVQNSLFDNNNGTDAGQFAGFYQIRQGISNNLTFEGSVQAIPDTIQSQAGLVWRVANPVVLSASVGNSFGKLAYNTDLDIQLGQLDITANSQSYPNGYRNGKNSGEFFNHSAEVSYRFNNKFQLGFLARSRKSGTDTNEYISPTFFLQPFTRLSLSGRPDITGQYLFNAYYQVNHAARLSFNTYGDRYASDLSYNFNRNYQVSLGTDFGGNYATRYTATLNYSPASIRQLSWRMGLAYREGNFGPIVGASMQVLPGLFARVEYQGIPFAGRRNAFGGFNDDRLTVSLVSDLSFAGGRAVPSSFSSLGKDRGAIAGRIAVSGENQGYDLQGASVRVINNHNKPVGGAKTDSSGNFFVGGLPEGVYRVEVDPEQLPVELTVQKTSRVAEVGMAGVTNVDFTARLEYGLAGRITDVAGQPMSDVRVELVNLDGTEVLAAMTDEFGLYRVDGVPVGKYTLRIPPQEAIANSETFPKRDVTIHNEFVYDQNLQLPISTAAKETKEK